MRLDKAAKTQVFLDDDVYSRVSLSISKYEIPQLCSRGGGI